MLEDLEENEEEWISLTNDPEKEKIVPFWPRDFSRGQMRVRVEENVASRSFPVNEKHRTLMKLDGHSSVRALLIEVIPTDFEGFEITFLDYQLEDLPLLLINFLPNESIAFAQKNSMFVSFLFSLSLFSLSSLHRSFFSVKLRFFLLNITFILPGRIRGVNNSWSFPVLNILKRSN